MRIARRGVLLAIFAVILFFVLSSIGDGVGNVSDVPDGAVATPSGSSMGGPTSSAELPPTVPTCPDDRTRSSEAKRGLPSPGDAYLGASTGGDIALFEEMIGAKVGLHRSYFGPERDEIESAVDQARQDLAAGRLPWLSFKLPRSWAEMASGAGDSWARDLASRLSGLDGPVWVAFHHEPEGDGPPEDWKRMQQRLSPIMRRAPNIAFTVILTGWNQFFSDSQDQSMTTYWPGSDCVDVLAFDPYNWYGTVGDSGETRYEWRELKDYYAKIVEWMSATGNTSVRWAIAETGYSDVAANAPQGAVSPDGTSVSAEGPGSEWLMRGFEDLEAMGGVALSYFSVPPEWVGAGRDRTWIITSEPKISIFRKTLALANTLPPGDHHR